MQSKNEYMCPVANPKINLGSPVHVGKLIHAIDYDCPEGTEVYAARGGTVVFVKNDSNVGGVQDMQYYSEGNRIVLKHEEDEYTAYEHLRFHGALVQVGDVVEREQLIGYSGNTGYSSGPHLHFEVFVNPTTDDFEGETVIPRFLEV